MNRSDRWFLRACFFLSGSAGLMLQIAWSKELSYILGNTLYAVSTVVAAFMTGLGLGSYVISRYGERIRRPVRVYAILEVAIGLLGALSIPFLRSTPPLFSWLQATLGANQDAFLFVRFLAIFVLLLPAVVLMGMTLPIVVGANARKSREDSHEAGLLYGLNTLGAVVGTLAASFVVVSHFGLVGTCVVAGALDLVAAVAAVWVDRRAGKTSERAVVSAEEKRVRTAPPPMSSAQWGVIILFAVSGAVAIGYEVAWFRVLGLTFGPSVYAFASMLAMYLLGIGVGSAAAGPYVQRMRTPGLIAFGALETVLGAVGLVVLVGINQLPGIYASIFGQLLGTIGAQALPVSQLILAAILVLLPCLVMGILFPVVVRAFREAGPDYSPERNIGRLYVWNTAGGILGSLLTGFVILPRLGVRATLLLAGVASCAIGVSAVLLARREAGKARRAKSGAPPIRWWLGPVLPGLVAALLFAIVAPPFNISVFNQGSYRDLYGGQKEKDTAPVGQLIFHREGANASVAVYRSLGSAALHIGGKPDASTNTGDILTQCFSGHLAMFFAPTIENVAVLGFGSGMTAGAVLAYPEVKHLDLMEIEHGVIEAAPYFSSINREPLADPRTNLILEDGRIHLTYVDRTYDVIISEPSNPWMVGVSNLFTTEFYEIVRSRLRPGGVFVQWIQNYDLSGEAFAVILASIRESFPHFVVFQTNPWDMVVLISDEPLVAPWERVLRRVAGEDVQESLARTGVRDLRAVPFFLIAPEEAAHAVADMAPRRNTDDNVWLEHDAPLAMLSWLASGDPGADAANVLVETGAPHRAASITRAFPGIDYVEALRALISFPHRFEPGLIQPGMYRDPWATSRTVQIPALIASLEARAAGQGDWPPGSPDGTMARALADSVRLWEERGLVVHRARAGAEESLLKARGEDEMRTALERALAVAPDLPRTRFALGLAAATAGDSLTAREAFTSVLADPASSAHYFSLLGLAQLDANAGDLAGAAEWTDRAQQHSPYFANAFVFGAQLRAQLGDIEGARERVRRGLVFNPNHSQLEELDASFR